MKLYYQKIIRFIPLVQFLTVLCWVNLYRANNLKYSDWIKAFLKMILIVLMINVPRIILHFVFESEALDIIIFYLTLYPNFFSVSNIAVRDQERQMKTLTP